VLGLVPTQAAVIEPAMVVTPLASVRANAASLRSVVAFGFVSVNTRRDDPLMLMLLAIADAYDHRVSFIARYVFQ